MFELNRFSSIVNISRYLEIENLRLELLGTQTYRETRTSIAIVNRDFRVGIFFVRKNEVHQ